MNKYSLVDSIPIISEFLGRNIKVDEESLKIELEAESNTGQSPIFILLSFIGGIFTVLLFLYFVYTVNIIESFLASLIIGLGMLGACIYMSVRSEGVYLEAIACGCLLGGLFMISTGMNELNIHHYLITAIILCLTVATLFFVNDFSLILFAFLIILSCIIYFLVDIFKSNALFLIMSTFCLFFSRAIHKEADWIVKWKTKLHFIQPLIIALYVACVTSFIFYWVDSYFEHPQLFIITSKILIILAAVSYYIWSSSFMNNHNIRIIYTLGLVLVLLPFYNYPVVPGFVMMILHCYYSKRPWMLLLSAICLVFSLSHFYYTLQWTLLNKSLVLIGSGLLFTFAFFLHNKYFLNGETS